jgi:hypothetical protein
MTLEFIDEPVDNVATRLRDSNLTNRELPFAAGYYALADIFDGKC